MGFLVGDLVGAEEEECGEGWAGDAAADYEDVERGC